MAITTPDAVPGEVIEAAWGDAVRADLTMLDNKDTTNYNLLNAAKVNKAGDTITPGLLNVGAAGSATQPGGTYGAGAVVLGLDTNARNITIYKIGSPAADTGSPYMGFYRGATAVGTITVASATSVAYNTTSDPRTKTPPGATGRGIDDADGRVLNSWAVPPGGANTSTPKQVNLRAATPGISCRRMTSRMLPRTPCSGNVTPPTTTARSGNRCPIPTWCRCCSPPCPKRWTASTPWRRNCDRHLFAAVHAVPRSGRRRRRPRPAG